MLSPYRVLDLSDERGQFAGLVLAQLGADVINVEPPTGSQARRREPSAGGESLVWQAWNRGKRSVVLDRSVADDRELLLRLVRTADVLIESGRPGELTSEGLGYRDLAALHPGLVYVSITPFGHTGPKAGWAATDLTVWASAGPLALTGDSDRAPLRVPGGQAFLNAAGEAVGAAIVALIERARSGQGQHVDVSAQQCSTMATQAQILNVAYDDDITERSAGGSAWGALVNRYLYPARDGHVSVTPGFGSALGHFTVRLAHWIYEEGGCDETIRDTDWVSFAALVNAGLATPADHERLKDVIARFTATKTKAELLTAAFERKLLIAPVCTMEDLLASEHLETRRFWDDLNGAGAPGQWAHIAPRALLRLRAAPSLGEHTEEVLASLPPPGPVSAPSVTPGAERPLAGLRVLDITWSMAGPIAVRALADYGATVVRVESGAHTDLARTLRPFDRRVDPPVSGSYADINAGKLGLSLNLASAEGHEVALDLVRWADVVCESFSPGTMASLGLGYETLRTLKPELVMLSSSLMGQDGPLARYVGFGTAGAALAGFTHLTGWPDRDPAGPYSAYTDYVSPRLAVAAVLAAVDHRRRTGEGTFIDLSQTEAGIMFLTPAALEAALTSRAPGPVGNADPDCAPHGVYRTAGDDEWVAIACADDDHWAALARLLGRPALSSLTVHDRRRGIDELDEAIGAWTVDHTADDVQLACQAAGIPAHRVQNSGECWSDPQLGHRRHFREVPHSTAGSVWVQAPRVELSRTPADVAWAGPELGEHTWPILEELLGYDADRISQLLASGALD